MAEANGSDNIEINTGFGKVIAHGTAVFIVIALFGLTASTIWEHQQRSIEHRNLEQALDQQTAKIENNLAVLKCLNRLAIYLRTVPVGTPIIWSEIPQEYWDCLPGNLVNKGKEIR